MFPIASLPRSFRPEQVTGSQTLKLVHDRFKGKPPAEVLQGLAADMAPASEGNREIQQHLGKAMEDLSALRVRACLLACVVLAVMVVLVVCTVSHLGDKINTHPSDQF